MRRSCGALLVLVIFAWPGIERLLDTRMSAESTYQHPSPDARARADGARRESAGVTPPATLVPAAFRRAPLLFLSTAPVDSLVLLPGIGPVIAERIASARSGKRLFTRWEDVLAIKGIGPKKLERLQTLATQVE